MEQVENGRDEIDGGFELLTGPLLRHCRGTVRRRETRRNAGENAGQRHRHRLSIASREVGIEVGRAVVDPAEKKVFGRGNISALQVSSRALGG